MKNNFTVFLLFLFSLFYFSSCNNKNEPAPIEISKEQHLSHNNWKLHTVETTPAIEGINAMDFLEECYTDNIYSFLSGGILSIDEGTSKCNEGDLQVFTGVWKISDDQEQLELKYGTFDQNFNIIEINEEQMKVQTTIDYQGFSILGTLTFLPYIE